MYDFKKKNLDENENSNNPANDIVLISVLVKKGKARI